MSKIDIDKFVCSLRRHFGENKGIATRLDSCLRDQGLKFIDTPDGGRLEKQGEQKLVVIPKFRVGDWLQYRNAKPFFVKEITKQGYVNGDSCLPFNWENEIHLWTIQDAKAGDVLACPNDAGDRDVVFIFKNINSDEGWVFCFCASDANGCFCTNNDYVGNSNSTNISPATKDKRELLFQKMREAGYEWDAEKKELKKIEQKFNIGDEIKTANEEPLTITKIDEKGYWSKDLFICCFDDAAKWELVEQNPAWSEEDDKNLEKTIWYVEKGGKLILKKTDKLVSWLKSLRPQNHWKPSDGQIKVCKEIYADLLSAKGFDLGTVNSELNRLEEELKKLKG